MVNEFVYCPRLFHLEWVQGRFASNDDVEAGRFTHRVVDHPGGNLPSPDDEVLEGRRARSVWLSSPRLGVSAKLDLVDTACDGEVVPIDYKKGRPGPDGRPWPSDSVQCALQVLLLRDAGYRCSTAELWYAETRQRIRMSVDREVEEHARAVLSELRVVAASAEAPPPLVDSPKCPRCSLVGICLPDEVNTLLHRQTRPPRRVVPRNPDDGPLYITEQGAVVGVHGGRIEVSKGRQVIATARLIDVSQVNVYGNVTVSAYAMRECLAREVPVCWFSYGGWFTGLAAGLPAKHVDLNTFRG
jgi:CRISPR-associated protein Cas1